MSLAHLFAPISSAHPTGEDCRDDARYEKALACGEYLAQCAEVEELRRSGLRAEKAGDKDAAAISNMQLGTAQTRRKSLEERMKSILPGAMSPGAVADAMVTVCEDLLTGKGKDLRVVSLYALGMAGRDGLDGALAAIGVFRQLLSSYPDTLHPVPEDESDRRRVGALESLTRNKGLRDVLRESALWRPASGPPLRLRDAEVLAGSVPADPSRGTPPRAEDAMAVLRQQLAEETSTLAEDVPQDDVRRAVRARHVRVDAALTTLDGLCRELQVSPNPTDPLLRQLSAVSALFSTLTAATGDGAKALSFPSSAALAPGPRDETDASRLRDREQARRQILEIAAYIDASMPGHPSPLFLRRAEKLLGAKDFFEIVTDMFEPNQTSHVEKITGQRAPQPPRPGAN